MNITPRLFNITLVSLTLCALYFIGVQNNTAQDAPAEPAAVVQEGEAVPTEPTQETPPAEPPTISAQEGEPTQNDATPDAPAFPEVVQDGPIPNIDAATAPPAESDEALEETEELPQANYQGLITLLVFFVLVFGCYGLGNIIAKQCRLPEHGFKIFIVLFAFFGGFAALIPFALGWRTIPLGIDLQGGVVLVYDAKPIQGVGKQDVDSAAGFDMDQLTRAIGMRIDPGGVKQIPITKLGTGQVQIVIPHAEAAEVARIRRVVSESGALTFRILASTAYTDDADIIRRGEAEQGRDVLDSTGRVLARWVPVFDSERSNFGSADMVVRERGKTLYALVKYDDGVDITGDYLTHVGRGVGSKGGPGVSFNFTSVGANKFGRLTSANRPDPAQPNRIKRYLGIVLNDSLYSAPTINSTIRESGIIEFTTRNTEAERLKLNRDIEDLIGVLHAGALPAELSKEPAAEMQIGATLGKDTIEKAKWALTAAAIITIAFMVFYYRLAGCIASFCVITNTVLIVAVMLALEAAFTLPGLAGLVLTIGMAIDANILIYERIREELAGGASLKMAIRNGYAKAFSAIFDSNITTIFVGIILYWVGTEQVKGFAVTLVLGITLNLFTAIFCARVIMDVLASQRWVKTYNMMQLFKRPSINFLSARNFTVALSLTLIIIGLVAVFARGRGILDIDFVGGVSVEAVFKQTQDIGEMRAMLEKDERLHDLSVQDVQAAIDDEGRNVLLGTRFIITSSTPPEESSPETYLETVKTILKETFGNNLDYRNLEYQIESSRRIADYDETTVHIKRYPKINHDGLASEIGARIAGEFSAPTITRQDYTEGDTQAFEDWTLVFRAPTESIDKILSTWKEETNETPNFASSNIVGGSVARHTRIQGIAAIIASLVVMAIYISVRFTRWQYGLIAVIGLLHDVLVVLGLLALSKWCVSSVLMIDEFRIGLPVVAAFLTVIAYSINDTIILFDRIRENLGKSTVLTGSMINLAINQTLSRTVLTSATTFLVAMILYVFGGQGIHAFAFAIAAGIACGTYSTICICSPLLFWAIGKDDLKPGDSINVEKW